VQVIPRSTLERPVTPEQVIRMQSTNRTAVHPNDCRLRSVVWFPKSYVRSSSLDALSPIVAAWRNFQATGDGKTVKEWMNVIPEAQLQAFVLGLTREAFPHLPPESFCI
jgi:hypothetical protein